MRDAVILVDAQAPTQVAGLLIRNERSSAPLPDHTTTCVELDSEDEQRGAAYPMDEEASGRRTFFRAGGHAFEWRESAAAPLVPEMAKSLRGRYPGPSSRGLPRSGSVLGDSLPRVTQYRLSA
jgi:hypothetical protein